MKRPQRHGNTWAVIGGGPSAPEYFDAALRCADTWITCNSGWQLFAAHRGQAGLYADQLLGGRVLPHVYYLRDERAWQLHGRAVAFMRDFGVRVVTLQRASASRWAAAIDGRDEVLALATSGAQDDCFVQGKWVHPRLSGLFILQYALNHGARRVILVGLDGYASKPKRIVPDGFDGRAGNAGGQELTAQWIRPFTQSCVEARADARFVVCGRPRYRIEGPNVRHVTDPAALTPEPRDAPMDGWAQYDQAIRRAQTLTPTP